MQHAFDLLLNCCCILKQEEDDSIFTTTTIFMTNMTSRGQMPPYIAYPQIKSVSGSDIVTRFAPSPNGLLHIGHAYAAICAHDFAHGNNGRFLLRIEDIDGTRSRHEHIDAILADLKWLGLEPDGDVIFQSTRVDSYRTALAKLQDMGLLYRCSCSRSDIAKVLKTNAVRHGPDGPHYPGTCRGKDIGDGEFCWRLDIAAAIERTGILMWSDMVAGDQIADPGQFGDIVLWRKDVPASYHLAATIDDAADGISHVVRGQDLFAYTALHRLLQALLDLPTPLYWHHGLLIDESGEKLAKSRASASLATQRIAGGDGLALATSLRSGQLPLGISLIRS
jgi:glutamyl-Q tRNA(Asp) synthetase